jgi:WD40 repeat protein
LEIYSGNTSSGDPEKSINKFREIAYGGKFRKDGKLIVSGSADGIVRVFTRWAQELKSFRGHKGDVWLTQFSQNMTDIMSAGDDSIIVNLFFFKYRNFLSNYSTQKKKKNLCSFHFKRISNPIF